MSLGTEFGTSSPPRRLPGEPEAAYAARRRAWASSLGDGERPPAPRPKATPEDRAVLDRHRRKEKDRLRRFLEAWKSAWLEAKEAATKAQSKIAVLETELGHRRRAIDYARYHIERYKSRGVDPTSELILRQEDRIRYSEHRIREIASEIESLRNDVASVERARDRALESLRDATRGIPVIRGRRSGGPEPREPESLRKWDSEIRLTEDRLHGVVVNPDTGFGRLIDEDLSQSRTTEKGRGGTTVYIKANVYQSLDGPAPTTVVVYSGFGERQKVYGWEMFEEPGRVDLDWWREPARNLFKAPSTQSYPYAESSPPWFQRYEFDLLGR